MVSILLQNVAYRVVFPVALLIGSTYMFMLNCFLKQSFTYSVHNSSFISLTPLRPLWSLLLSLSQHQTSRRRRRYTSLHTKSLYVTICSVNTRLPVDRLRLHFSLHARTDRLSNLRGISSPR